MTREQWIDGYLVTVSDWLKPGEIHINVARIAPGGRISAPDWEKSMIVSADTAPAALDNLSSVVAWMVSNPAIPRRRW